MWGVQKCESPCTHKRKSGIFFVANLSVSRILNNGSVWRERAARKGIQNDKRINYSRLEREEGRGDSDKGNCGAGDAEATGTVLLVSSGGCGGGGSGRGAR